MTIPIGPRDPLSELTRQYFDSLPQGGPLPEGQGACLKGEAGSVEGGTWVRFRVRVLDGRIEDARFQAYGCPHTLAVASWLASALIGRQRSDPLQGTPDTWAAQFSVPTPKLGRLLVIEDAARECLQGGPASVVK